jgi:hypothetical protein
MIREYSSATIADFLSTNSNEILGKLSKNNEFVLEPNQKISWEEEIEILKRTLIKFEGHIFFEYSVPRMGKRIDVLLVINRIGRDIKYWN